MQKEIIIIGAGLGGLSTALRLSGKHKITILEKSLHPGGRVNFLNKGGFKFDLGPSFMSMSYELDELFSSIGIKNPVKLSPLDPVYQVFFEGRNNPIKIYKDLLRLQEEFAGIEDSIAEKAEKYINHGGEFFHDTMDKVVKRNFNSMAEYLAVLSTIPKKHIPYLFRSVWNETGKVFSSYEARVIFSLVAFFLGSTPFNTPAIYSLLNYTEMKNDGYWRVHGGMYKLVEEIVKVLESRNVEIVTGTEIVRVESSDGKITSAVDIHGKKWSADVFISNSDAAFFRGSVLGREKYSEKKLDKMHWTLAPFTVYLGVKGEVKNLMLHNYFLGKDFKDYADGIFVKNETPSKPYYYVNVLSREEKDSAPAGHENIFILCPVPDLRYKNDWSDKQQFADILIKDLSDRTGYNICDNIVVKEVFSPEDWGKKFNLYKGSGLGLAHDIKQVGAFRPKNRDEYFNNLYYVGASTTPGTGIPMVIISSKLVTDRMKKDGIII
jgi:phytoene desaturase